ncbi:hypothetical protein [Nocardioides sp.]|uniref:phage tail tube protein n=1 Tax=Nocardioides sp. TaxID=35761 RepID=UPI002611A195|nr:hypothetical protein [Nocardioides sp.]
MPAVMPETVKSDGNKLVIFMKTAPAAATGIPTLSEINDSLFASLFLYSPFDFTPNQNTGEAPKKLGSTVSETEFGNINYPAVEAQYSYVPQKLGTPGYAANAVYELLEPGTILTAVVLDGYDGTVDEIAAGDVADVFLIKAGVRKKGRTGDGEYDRVSAKQSLLVVGGEPIVEDHKIAA